MKLKNNLNILILIVFALFIGGAFLFYTNQVKKDTDLIGFFKMNLTKPKNGGEGVYLKFFDDIKNDFIFGKLDFLEVNLEKMKIRLFKQGELTKEFVILAKGDSGGWGGSAVGLYSILSGHRVSFSNIEEVYMPNALHYYGKYYIHGEPYYIGGKKLESVFSGGCLRLKDEDAKELFELSDLNMPVLVIDKEREGFDLLKEELPKEPNLTAQGFLVADLGSGFVFLEKNSQKVLPIASLTKLMTALTVVENVNLKRTVLIRQNMLDLGYGVTEGLDTEKRFRVTELLYPLLIESSNDSAYALTWLLGRERTIDLMNEKAKSILMQKTNFVEPSGFDPKNVSTAQDLFYLARYIYNNRHPFLEITKGNKVVNFGEVAFDIKNLWNKNIFIYDPTFVGGKTGFTKESKHTALFIFRFEDGGGKERNVAIILLGSSNLRQDTQKIYIWLQKNFFN